MARRTKEDAVATRNGLIDAAEQVFREKGVSRASLSDIAQAAGSDLLALQGQGGSFQCHDGSGDTSAGARLRGV